MSYPGFCHSESISAEFHVSAFRVNTFIAVKDVTSLKQKILNMQINYLNGCLYRAILLWIFLKKIRSPFHFPSMTKEGHT